MGSVTVMTSQFGSIVCASSRRRSGDPAAGTATAAARRQFHFSSENRPEGSRVRQSRALHTNRLFDTNENEMKFGEWPALSRVEILLKFSHACHFRSMCTYRLYLLTKFIR